MTTLQSREIINQAVINVMKGKDSKEILFTGFEDEARLDSIARYTMSDSAITLGYAAAYLNIADKTDPELKLWESKYQVMVNQRNKKLSRREYLKARLSFVNRLEDAQAYIDSILKQTDDILEAKLVW